MHTITPPPEGIHPITETRNEQRRVLQPLRAILRTRLGAKSFDQISRLSGLSPWRAMRIISGTVAAPSYVDLTELVLAAGLTPNQAAQICGLYTPPDQTQEENGKLVLDLDEVDPRLVNVIQTVTGSELSESTREGLMRHLYALVENELQLDRQMREGVRRKPRRRTAGE